jgi:hypothetical protein
VTESDSEIEAVLGRRPRKWHYEFAHMALPKLLFDQPNFFLSTLDDPSRSLAPVSATVARVAENCGLSPDEARIIANSIKIHRHLHVSGECIVRLFVLEMPMPLLRSECYFVAIAYALDGGVHYFTLEKASKDPSVGMLCSWNAEGRHSNFGNGTPADVDSFVNAVGRRLCGYAN